MSTRHDWSKHCYARLLIDNHISEDDPAFMTKFDPAQYVAMAKQAGVESSMVYAVCHNGNSYYPTQVGHMHLNLKGRDIFGETVNLLRKEGIAPIAYYTSIWHNHSAKNHPAWRLTKANGGQHDGRYWWSCPNNDEYVAFILAQIGEVLAYDVDGIFNDMTFWPAICVCSNCRVKYLKATGRELPIPIKPDWRSKAWIEFQRFRERSLAAFTQKITDFIKSKKAVTVTHQTGAVLHGWFPAYTLGIAAACDYTSGDFYGGKYQHIFGAKVLAALSRNMPYEFMTSRCVNLRDHTSLKSEAELAAEAAVTLANAGAYFFIDAINPDGTLEKTVYERLGAVSQKLAPFTQTVKRHVPDIVADKALYYSSTAYIDENAAADIMSTTPCATPAAEEIAGTSVLLTRAHIPFRVISSATRQFNGLNTIVMNNILYTTQAENERIRKFVRAGGTLIATGLTSLYEPDGTSTGDFGLADVLGVSFTGGTAKRFHYLSFVAKHWLISCYVSAPLVKAKEARLIAKIAEPLFDPDSEEYASIHSNPPGVITDYAGLTLNKYGQGKCLYLASPVFSLRQDAQQALGAWLFSEYAPSALVVETNAPACVEITLLKSTTGNAYIAAFVNYQNELPNVPVRDLYATIRLPDGVIPKSCIRVSDNKKIAVKIEQGALRLEVPYLETIEMMEVRY